MKSALTTFWVTLISFSSKVMGQLDKTIDGWHIQNQNYNPNVQGIYWVPNNINPINQVLNAVQRLTAIAIFIIWIVNLIRIIRTNDKNLRKKRIKNTIIVISILIIILIACFLITYLLKR